MIKHLDNGGLADRACLKVLHAIFAGQGNRLNLRHGVVVGGGSGRRALTFLHLWATRGQIDHVTDENFNRALTALAFVDPLLDLFETAALCDVEHEEAGCAAVHVLVDIFMVPLASWHVKVDDFVLVCIVDVVSRLNMQLSGLLVLHDRA